MKIRFASALLLAFLGFGVTGCDVDVEGETEPPDIDMDVEPGQLPDVDVRGPDVDVGMEEKTVEVPDVDIDIPEEDDNEFDSTIDE